MNARTINLFVPNCYKTAKFLFFYFSCKDNSNIAIYPWAWMCWRGMKTEYIWKLTNFNFQWTKTSYQNILNHVAFFFILFKSYKCKKLYEIAPKKRFLLEPKEIPSKFHGNWENTGKIKITHFPNGMLVMSLRGVNYRFWSHMWCLRWQSHCICPFKYHLGLCIKKFTYKALTLTTFGAQFKLEPHPHSSPLRVWF